MKRKIILVLICIILSSFAIANVIEGGLISITKSIDIELGQETKDVLTVLSTVESTICITEEIKCLQYNCLKVDNIIGDCIEFGDKCLKKELICIEKEIVSTPIGIISPKIISKGCTDTLCCYDLIEEPYYHRYNTCIETDIIKTKQDNENAIMEYLKNDLEHIAEVRGSIDKEVKIDLTPNNLEVNIK